MIGFGKMCIAKFSTFVTQNKTDRYETVRDARSTIALLSLKVSNLYTILCGFYGSPNEQIWISELCTFSLIQSQL